MSTSVILSRVKSVRTYRPNLYIYKAIFIENGPVLTGTSQNLADSLSYMWRLYIDSVLNLSSINYTVYTNVYENTYASNMPGITNVYIFTYTYLIFEHGVFIPCFSSGGTKSTSGLSNLNYTFNYETFQAGPSSSSLTSQIQNSATSYPMPMRILCNQDTLKQFSKGVNLLTSSLPLVDLYGANSIGNPTVTNNVSWYSATRFTFDQLNIDTYAQGVQFVMENINWPPTDSYDPTKPITTSMASSNFYQNEGNEQGVNPNDNAETAVIVNEFLTNTKSINLKLMMLQSPQLFIKYGEYLLLVYRYAVTHNLGPINSN